MMMTRARTEAERKRKRENENIVQQERSVVCAKQLLPNISDDVTLQVICGKLPWSTFRTLSFVSPTWHRAIQSGEIFVGRAVSHSAETFAVINHTLRKGIFGLRLYSVGDSPKCRETLPPIPGIKKGIPQSCECITLDGKLYILGGWKDYRTQLGSADVYMLNLRAGPRQWRKCASMCSRRHNFRACIMNGKIYVCGGSSGRAPVCVTEVYDPEADTWTALMPMTFARTGHDSEIVDGELLVYGGRMFDANFRVSEANFRRESRRRNIPEEHYTYRANHVEVYNPVQNKWRRVLLDVPEVAKPDERRSDELFFIAHGSLHCMWGNDIFVFDFKTLSWNFLCSMSEDHGAGWYNLRISNSVRAIQILDNKVFVICAPWQQYFPGQGPFVRLNMRLGLDPGAQVDRTPRNWIVIDEDLCFEGLVSGFIRVLKL